MPLEALSGNSYLGIFKNLNKLILDVKYIHTVTNIYEENKNGKILFNKNTNENILILTTCSKDKQLIIETK